MTALSIYKNALLPEIIDYCQTFLFSLFENASTACNLEQSITQNEINNSFEQVINWLKRCLTAPLTQISEASFREINKELIDVTEQFTQQINQATDSGITPATNPLAQHRLMDAIEKILLNSCLNNTEDFQLQIESHFCMNAKSFYLHLNRLCKSCLSPHSSIEHSDVADPLNIFDSPDVFTARQAPASSYSDTEAAIEEVKNFFESDIFIDVENIYFSTLCKKMYIPILNSVIKDPESFLEVKSKHPIREIFSAIENIGLYSKAINCPEENAILSEVATVINSFIEISMTNTGSIHKPLSKLNKFAKQCKRHLKTNTTTPQEVESIASEASIINTAQPNNSSSKSAHEADIAASDPIKPQEQKVTADLAKRYVDAIISNTDVKNSLSEILQKQWQVTLTFIGKVHGLDSNEWQHALKLIVELAKQTSIETISVTKAKQVDSFFRFAGVKSEIISVRTLAPPIDAKYATILKEGKWFDLDNNGTLIRCKLAGIIKQIGRYIFISRQGQKVFEVDFNGVTEALDSGRLKPKNDVSLSNTLEDILSNIKNASSKDLEHNEFS